jgi:hypothetical protein
MLPQGLLEAMERGELPAVPQPAGLTVQMRPYQLQSLQFMLDCERGEGGFRRLFWLPVCAGPPLDSSFVLPALGNAASAHS